MATPLRILTIIGARPQIIKAAAISHAVSSKFKGRIQETLLTHRPALRQQHVASVLR
jgi:UDP-N-acetylglucosamine 2-epimerase